MEIQSSSMTSSIELSAIEARVLASLMEKQLLTPDVYPLTLNSLLLACNQKTSREPVSNYSSAVILQALQGLEERKLIESDYGSRATRYAQKLVRQLGVDKSMQSLVALLLLRGPQTVQELLVRSQRMANFANAEEIKTLLDHYCEKTHPVICFVPKRAGQREDRYSQLLCVDAHQVATADASEQHVAEEEKLHAKVEMLESKVEQMEQQIQQLQEALAALQ